MPEPLSSLYSLAYGACRDIGKAILVYLAVTTASHAETLTIAALGDSLTQGFGLVQEDGFVPQLQGWLQDQGYDVEVLNAGVSGDTTAGGLARVGWTLTPEVDAMIVTLGGNDLLRGLPPEASRANLDGILAAAAEADVDVMLVGLTAPGNYGPDWQAAFNAMYPELAEDYGAIYVESFLAPLEEAAGGDQVAAVAQFMQSDGIHPNAEGVAVIVEALGPSVGELIERAAVE